MQDCFLQPLPESVADILVNILFQGSSVGRDVVEVGSIGVGPSGVVQLSLPGPVDPSVHSGGLVKLLLGGPELGEEGLVLPINAGGHAPFTGDLKVLATDDARVGAGAVHERVLVAVVADSKANVVVVVESSHGVGGNSRVGARVARAPLAGHELHMQLLVAGNVQGRLGRTDSLECGRVVGLRQARVFTRGRVAAVGIVVGNRLVENLDHTDGGVGRVGMDAVGHP